MLDAAGFDVVLLETVGVGQSEIEVADLADTTLVLLAPGMGDGVQAAKAGILEIGDIFVVNKSDRDGAQALIRSCGAWSPSASVRRTPGSPDRGHRGPSWRGHRRPARPDRAVSRHPAGERGVDRPAGRPGPAGGGGSGAGRLQTELALDPEAGLDALAETVSRGQLDAYTAADRLRPVR